MPRFAGKTFRESWEKNSSLPNEVTNFPRNEKDSTVTKNNSLHSPHHPNVLPESNTNRVEQFTTELSALGGHVYQTNIPTQDIIEFLKSRGLNSILLEPNTLDESLLRKADIEFTHKANPKILVGVTKAICGLADTGSVLEADSALLTSLLPEIHIAILKSEDILPSLPDAINLVKDKNAAVFITGPSRTADIEMTLTIGVHGPKEIHVFVDDSISR